MSGGVYAIKNKKNGKVYVGSTQDLRIRKNQHFSDLRCGRHPNTYLQRSFSKHGESAFEWIVLEEVESIDVLAECELSWINKLDATNSSIGFNIALDTVSPMRGREHPSAGKKRPQVSGQSHHNSKLTEHDVREIFRLHENGMNQGEIAEKFGIKRGNVSMILTGKAWSHLGIKPIAGRANNKSGCVGVYQSSCGGKWVSEIIVKGKHIPLGRFGDKESAINARKKAEEDLSDTK